MSNIVWIGPRESDIRYTGDFFKKSITLYGDNLNSNEAFCATKNFRINHNNITPEQTIFMNDKEMGLIDSDPDVRFMAYNPILMEECDPRVQDHLLCYNKKEVLEFFNSKISFRMLSSSCVPTLKSKCIEGSKCSFKNLKNIFSQYDSFIIQSNISSGGYGTYLLDRYNEERILNTINKYETYLVSPYYKNNIPINIHAVIYDDDIVVFPASIQIMIKDKDRLLYRGADYIAYNRLEKKIKQDFEINTIKLCKKTQEKGYRGVLGIDAIIVNNEILMLEINNRFQASTVALNCALNEYGLKSIHELNYESFVQKKSSIDKNLLKKLVVNYSCFVYINESEKHYIKHVNHIMDALNKSSSVKDVLLDGYDKSCSMIEDEAYLFRVVFNTNIVDISPDKTIRIHPNIITPTKGWYYDIINKTEFIKLKISLINQGVVLSNKAKLYIKEKGGMRPGVYCSVDITVDNKYVINSPLYVKFAELSPFLIDYTGNELKLYYYGTELYSVTIDFEDKKAKTITSSGVQLNRIGLLTNDRLRIQNCSFCTFKEKHVPCKFCEVQYMEKDFGIKDILEVVKIYLEDDNLPFRHILIGGLSNDVGKEKNNILKICNYVRSKTDMPIYLMCLPPRELSDIDDYISAGVNEFGFNIEIFDRDRAKKIMPGKGSIPIEQYYSALRYAAEKTGKNGEVRSALVIGLEKKRDSSSWNRKAMRDRSGTYFICVQTYTGY